MLLEGSDLLKDKYYLVVGEAWTISTYPVQDPPRRRISTEKICLRGFSGPDLRRGTTRGFTLAVEANNHTAADTNPSFRRHVNQLGIIPREHTATSFLVLVPHRVAHSRRATT